MSSRQQRKAADPVRITTAPRSRHEDIATRQRRYIMSMTLRVICFVGAIIVGEGPVFWVLLAGAIFLPYIAVILANATVTRTDEPGLRTVSPAAPELGGGTSRHDP